MQHNSQNVNPIFFTYIFAAIYITVKIVIEPEASGKEGSGFFDSILSGDKIYLWLYPAQIAYH